MRNHPLRRLTLAALLAWLCTSVVLAADGGGLSIAADGGGLSIAADGGGLSITADGGGLPLAADGGGLRVEIDAPDTLRAGEHASLTVRVDLPPEIGNDTPLLLTPTVEGAAVEVVRGRLFRADAKVTGPHQLSFQLPVVGQREGAAILRVDASTYACKKRCLAITASAEKVLRVGAR